MLGSAISDILAAAAEAQARLDALSARTQIGIIDREAAAQAERNLDELSAQTQYGVIDPSATAAAYLARAAREGNLVYQPGWSYTPPSSTPQRNGTVVTNGAGNGVVQTSSGYGTYLVLAGLGLAGVLGVRWYLKRRKRGR